ncbi:hypothetical protein VTN02DRAFT_1000 [Thermoascus thermophilus]
MDVLEGLSVWESSRRRMEMDRECKETELPATCASDTLDEEGHIESQKAVSFQTRHQVQISRPNLQLQESSSFHRIRHLLLPVLPSMIQHVRHDRQYHEQRQDHDREEHKQAGLYGPVDGVVTAAGSPSLLCLLCLGVGAAWTLVPRLALDHLAEAGGQVR